MQIIEMQPALTFLPITCADSTSPGKDMPTKAAPDVPAKKTPKKK